MRVAVLIVAAGRGTRLGAELPKQYMPILGSCSLRRCIDRFLVQDMISVVQPVIHPDDTQMYQTALQGVSDLRLKPAVSGGESRAKSVICGLDALENDAPDYVLVHDAARPFVTARVTQDVIAALKTNKAAFAALPIVDALWHRGERDTLTPVSRDGLWRAQTPQGFHFDALRDAHRAASGYAADDVEVARAAGIAVQIVRGDEDNFKITSPGDLERAERLLKIQSRGTAP